MEKRQREASGKYFESDQGKKAKSGKRKRGRELPVEKRQRVSRDKSKHLPDEER